MHRVLESGQPERLDYENPETGRCHEVHVSRLSETRMAQLFFDVTERRAASGARRRCSRSSAIG